MTDSQQDHNHRLLILQLLDGNVNNTDRSKERIIVESKNNHLEEDCYLVYD